jgi:hypothetical protein
LRFLYLLLTVRKKEVRKKKTRAPSRPQARGRSKEKEEVCTHGSFSIGVQPLISVIVAVTI